MGNGEWGMGNGEWGEDTILVFIHIFTRSKYVLARGCGRQDVGKDKDIIPTAHCPLPTPQFLSEREACYFVETQRSGLGGRDSLAVGDSGLVDCLARPGPGDERARLADAAARIAAAPGRHCDRRH